MWTQIHKSTDVGLTTLDNKDTLHLEIRISEVESGQDSEMTKRKIKGKEQFPC